MSLYCVLDHSRDEHCLFPPSPGDIFEKLYLGSVSAIKLNEYYAAALHDGKIHLHLVRLYNVVSPN